MIARLAGLALDARAAARSTEPRDRATAARWIAANLLAVRGKHVALDGEAPRDATMLGIEATDLMGALAAIAAVPALLDPETLPHHWRLALRALGVPCVDRPVPELLASGASVARLHARADVVLAVGSDLRVRVQGGYELVA